MIRCGWILTDLRGGGAERIPLVLGPSMLKTELTVLLLKDRIEHELSLETPRVTALSSGNLPLGRRAIRILRKGANAAGHFDVLVAGLEWAPTFFAASFGALARKPVVATVHVPLRSYDEIEPVPGVWWVGMRLGLRRCRAVVAVSEEIRSSVLELGIDERRVHVIPNPGPARPVVPNRGVKPLQLLTVASLRPRKGIDIAIEAASQLRDLSFEWSIVGDGPDLEKLTRRTADLGLSEHVNFVGFRADPQPFYAKADLYVLPSRLEGAPLVLLEALNAMLPIVGTNCGAGVREIVTPNVGELVSPDDPAALAAAIRKLVESPERIRRMSEAAGKRARAYAPAVIAEEYDSLLAGVVEAVRRDRGAQGR